MDVHEPRSVVDVGRLVILLDFPRPGRTKKIGAKTYGIGDDISENKVEG